MKTDASDANGVSRGQRHRRFAGRVLNFKLVRFALVGGLAAATDLTLFWLLNQRFGFSRLLAQSISRPTGGLVSFTANKFWTFERRSAAQTGQQFVRYAIIWVCSFALSTLLMEVYRMLLPVDPRFDFVSKGCAEGTLGLLSFLAQRFWAFRAPRP